MLGGALVRRNFDLSVTLSDNDPRISEKLSDANRAWRPSQVNAGISIPTHLLSSAPL